MSESEIVIAAIGCLTAREAEAVLWIAQGKTSWEAGRILGVSEHTMNTHVVHAAEKLRASNRAHMVARAFVEGVLAVAPQRLAALLMALAFATGGHDSLRAPRRAPQTRRREDVSAVIAAAA